MLPVGLLMKEHRVIERMIVLLAQEGARIRAAKKADLVFLDAAVDFIKTYADECHHGKEENILFRDLRKKAVADDHRKMMEQLIREHVYGRQTVAALVDARNGYAGGDGRRLQDIEKEMGKLAAFYPRHIDKEDNRFFFPVMAYFSEKEKEGMLEECLEFDRSMIHAKYTQIVAALEGRKG
ncbi:MAG: hemerythrin domain-containing protein [Deltaproteobacteria bacterium]